jgi:hypothetical protein
MGLRDRNFEGLYLFLLEFGMSITGLPEYEKTLVRPPVFGPQLRK